MNQTQTLDTHILTELGSMDLPAKLIDWLAKLTNLQGVPFNYLVGDQRFLPPESIRFFQLDATWQKALLDGALSIGRHYTPTATSLSLIADLTHRQVLHTAVKQEVPRQRKRQFRLHTGGATAAPGSNSATPAAALTTTTSPITGGFLLRSQVVTAWKSMDVAAYAQGSSPYDYETNDKMDPSLVKSLDILRLERLSADVLLGIFNGPVYEVVLHQPPEAIHFGFQRVNPAADSAVKDLRVPQTAWNDLGSKDDPGVKYDIVKEQTLSKFFRPGGGRVLDMEKLSACVAKQLSIKPGYYQEVPDSNHKDHLVSSDFGLEMVQGVGLVSFINQKLSARTN